MLEKLEAFIKRYEDLNIELSDSNVMSNPNRFRELSKEHSQITPIVEKFKEYKQTCEDINEYTEIIQSNDDELKELAKEELPKLKEDKTAQEDELKILLIPKDPNDDKNVILEIRAGTGGDEAAIFAADLFRMYTRYSEINKWKISVISSSPIGIGGYKEIIAQIQGDNVYSRMKYESGTHRVQRVPKTESGGRVHTSASTVAILPEAEEVDLQISPGDLRIDVYRSSGAGGQHVNTTDSAVRITHLPTNTVVTCQDEKSQHKNKAKAMTILRARIYETLQNEAHEARASDRKQQVGSGDRSERIRTYNYPQGRITDHRIGLTIYKLDAFIDGDLNDTIDALITHYQTEALKSNQWFVFVPKSTCYYCLIPNTNTY